MPHFTVIPDDMDVKDCFPIQACTGCELGCTGGHMSFHCPICPTSKYKPARKPRVLQHLRNHFYGKKGAVHIRGYRITGCPHFSCGSYKVDPTHNRTHLHCPFCERTFTKKQVFVMHLKKCRPSHNDQPVLEDIIGVAPIKTESPIDNTENIEQTSENSADTSENKIPLQPIGLTRVKTTRTRTRNKPEPKRMKNSSDMSETPQEQVLLEPYNYILQIPGKQIRMKLATAFNYWLHIPEDKLQTITEITQMLHNASLLIDDIEDNSHLRRGIPVAHHIFGVASTINSANYVYFLGLNKALTLDHPQVTRIYTEQLLELHRGQGMDIYWRDSYTCPTEEEYKAMVIKKTGGLFGLAVRLMQLFSDNQSDLKPLLDCLGLYFQIRDDLANLYSKEYEANKSFAEDLTEGKFSFPIIHGIKSQPEDTQIISILRQRTKDIEVKRYCVDILKKRGSFQYTKTVLVELEQQLLSHLEDLGGNPHLAGVIGELRKLYQQEDLHI